MSFIVLHPITGWKMSQKSKKRKLLYIFDDVWINDVSSLINVLKCVHQSTLVLISLHVNLLF